MALKLAPYNNAMRIGQGFNSFTQQICIDDAVIVSPNRAENVLTNDGNTMRLIALVKGAPSAWIKQEEVLIDEQQIEGAKEAREQIEKEISKEDDQIIPEANATTITNSEQEPEPEPKPEQEQEQEPEVSSQEPSAVSEPSPSQEPPIIQEPTVTQGDVDESNPPANTEEPKPSTDNLTTEMDAADTKTMTDTEGDDGIQEISDAKKASDADSKQTTDHAEDPKGTSDTDKKDPPTLSESGSGILVEESFGNEENIQPSEEKGTVKEVDEQGSTPQDVAEIDAPPTTIVQEPGEIDSNNSNIQQSQISQDDEGEKDADHQTDTLPAAQETTVPATQTDTPPAPSEIIEKKTEEKKAEEHVETSEEREKRLQKEEIERNRTERRLKAEKRAVGAASKYNKPEFKLEDMVKAQNTKQISTGKREAPGVSSSDNNAKSQVFNIKNSHGVSQTVVYRSFFVKNISDITNDMGLSAALAITGDSFNVGGRGSFIKPEKFKESHLNYYISVKVTNQSINFKDALEYQPIKHVDESEFRDVFGDCFISGFLEGGELNALISMNILNKSSAMRLALEASFSVSDSDGKWGVQGSGAFSMAKSNTELNTETTVAVSWLGGGNIKPPEEAWTIESLTRVATRFPDMVADSPQRTYAILTKYEHLRSFQALKPPKVTPIDYENATFYTNDLLDTFTTYKSIYGRLTKQIFAIQDGTLKFKTIDETKRTVLSKDEKEKERIRNIPREQQTEIEKKTLIGYLPDSLDGLDAARKAVRSQMNLIIKRVEDITKYPHYVLTKPLENFLAPFALETLFPPLESALKPRLGAPLTQEKMFEDEETAQKVNIGDEKETYGSMEEAHRLCYINDKLPKDGGLRLYKDETTAIEKYLASRDDGVEESIRLTPLFGNVDGEKKGDFFTSLDFIKPEFLIKSISFGMDNGVVSTIYCRYTNGLSWRQGLNKPIVEDDKNTLKIDSDERITSFIITVGAQGISKEATEAILGLKVVTNKGRNLEVKSKTYRRIGYARRLINEKLYSNVRTITFESPLERGYLTGFWGRCLNTKKQQSIIRLGALWTNECPATARKISNIPKPQPQLTAALEKKKTLAQTTDKENEEVVSDVTNLKSELQHIRLQLEKAKEAKEMADKERQDAEAAKAEAQKEKREAEIAKEKAENESQEAKSAIEKAEKESREAKKAKELAEKDKEAANTEAKNANEAKVKIEGEKQAAETGRNNAIKEKERAEQDKRIEAEKAQTYYKDYVREGSSNARKTSDLRSISRLSDKHIIQTSNGKNMDFWLDEKIYGNCKISDAHGKWNQKFYFEPRDDGFFAISCFRDGGWDKFKLTVQSDTTLKFVQNGNQFFEFEWHTSDPNKAKIIWYKGGTEKYVIYTSDQGNNAGSDVYALKGNSNKAKSHESYWTFLDTHR